MGFGCGTGFEYSKAADRSTTRTTKKSTGVLNGRSHILQGPNPGVVDLIHNGIYKPALVGVDRVIQYFADHHHFRVFEIKLFSEKLGVVISQGIRFFTEGRIKGARQGLENQAAVNNERGLTSYWRAWVR